MTTKEEIAQELFEFLEKKNVKDVFGHITEQLLMYKPSNVVRFVIRTLNNDFPDEATALDEGEVRGVCFFFRCWSSQCRICWFLVH